MAVKKRWSDFSPRTRRLIITAGIVDGSLKVAALIDIKRRNSDQIRGRKWIWATVVTVVNSVGIVPVSYFVFGRRQQQR
jgi:hypothetical protein